MTPLKQLFRQPVRLFAIFLLVGMASAFICLSAGVFASAKATLAQIEERYVTIGVPTTETADVATEYNGLTLHHEESVISQDMWAYMDQLAADGTVIKGAYQQKYISAYCPSIQSVTSGKEDGTYVPSLDSPYNRAIMIVRVTSVDKTNLPESTELALVSVTASIENVVKMHPDYAVRSTLRLIIGCNSQEELDALDIRPGGRYLAFGADYIDRDLELRTTLAGTHRCSVEDIDLSKISYDLTEDEKKTASPDFLPVAFRLCPVIANGIRQNAVVLETLGGEHGQLLQQFVRVALNARPLHHGVVGLCLLDHFLIGAVHRFPVGRASGHLRALKFRRVVLHIPLAAFPQCRHGHFVHAVDPAGQPVRQLVHALFGKRFLLADAGEFSVLAAALAPVQQHVSVLFDLLFQRIAACPDLKNSRYSPGSV